MSIGLEDYGYPKVDFMGKDDEGMQWARVVHGWFFWDDEDEDEYATYFEVWMNQHGRADVILCNPMIFFDFITPLDEYLLPCSKTMTIGDLYKEEVAVT